MPPDPTEGISLSFVIGKHEPIWVRAAVEARIAISFCAHQCLRLCVQEAPLIRHDTAARNESDTSDVANVGPIRRINVRDRLALVVGLFAE